VGAVRSVDLSIHSTAERHEVVWSVSRSVRNASQRPVAGRSAAVSTADIKFVVGEHDAKMRNVVIRH